MQAFNKKEWGTQGVIRRALEFICKEVLKVIEKKTCLEFKMEQVQWILTVPAIWSHLVFLIDSLNFCLCLKEKFDRPNS